MLIAFEGIDGSGKTELSTLFCDYLNFERKNLGQFSWTKEPDFTSEEADKLNKVKGDRTKEEVLFLISRLHHKTFIQHKNIICDRYLWSALAYSKVYSPNLYPFLKELYIEESLFIKPDLYIFVDTSIEECSEREKKQEKEKLLELWKSYIETEDLIKSPIIRVKSEALIDKDKKESIEIALEDLINRFETHMKLINK